MKRFLFGLLALGLLVAGTGKGKAQSSYIISFIDVPGSVDTYASGINDAGQIVGGYVDARGGGYGFILSGGTYTTLNVPGSVYTQAWGISNAGLIVGSYA